MPQSLNFGTAVLQVTRGGRGMSGNPSSEADKEDGFSCPWYFLVLLLRWGWWNRCQLIKRFSETLLFSGKLQATAMVCCAADSWGLQAGISGWSQPFDHILSSRSFGISLIMRWWCPISVVYSLLRSFVLQIL